MYFISAGEVSGDLIAADLIVAMRSIQPKLRAFGVTGETMKRAGAYEVASIEALSVMGITDVLKAVPDLVMLESNLLAVIDRMKPKFAVLVDYPGFHLRLADQLKLRGIPVFQYVAPKLWAWGEGRAKALRDLFHGVLGILPFEEEFFKSRGINYHFVGCPIKDRTDKVIVDKQKFGFSSDDIVIACLPGSRPSEIRLNLPTIRLVTEELKRRIPAAQFLVPVADGLPWDLIQSVTGLPARDKSERGSDWQTLGHLTFVRRMSLEVMALADAAIVASGTATLECALVKTPMVVVYTMSDLSYQIAKRAVKLPYVSLVNLVAGSYLVKEYIQEFSILDVANEVYDLLFDA
jgi:lipid-A-disaccharide synthase